MVAKAVYTVIFPVIDGMVRVSFRQVMLAGFVLVVVLLGGMAVRSWMLVENFVKESRAGGEVALQLSATIQELAESTVDVERSARQYLVLGDHELRLRHDESLAHALNLVARLGTLEITPLADSLAAWQAAAQTLSGILDDPARKAELAPLLTHLGALNQQIRLSGNAWQAERNAAVIDALERNRLQLSWQLLAALGAALFVASAMGWWLMRPMRHLERAISRLGEKRFDEAVELSGPADLRRLGRQLDWLRLRLAELEADRERTLRHVSHELKTPLTALREGVALLREEVVGPLGDGQREVVDILQHNAIALQRQIEGLLTLNAASFDAQRLTIAPVELAGFLGQVIAGRELHGQTRQVRVVLEAPSDRWVRIDAGKLGVVVDNLLSNAIDFSPDAGVVTLRAICSEAGLHIECLDQGPGVAEEDVLRIFEPFVQGQRRAPSARRGSGVGLSIVRELVRAMRGTVGVVPSAGGGQFFLDIPNEGC